MLNWWSKGHLVIERRHRFWAEFALVKQTWVSTNRHVSIIIPALPSLLILLEPLLCTLSHTQGASLQSPKLHFKKGSSNLVDLIRLLLKLNVETRGLSAGNPPSFSRPPSNQATNQRERNSAQTKYTDQKDWTTLRRLTRNSLVKLTKQINGSEKSPEDCVKSQ